MAEVASPTWSKEPAAIMTATAATVVPAATAAGEAPVALQITCM
jgi:hypothetical protein